MNVRSERQQTTVVAVQRVGDIIAGRFDEPGEDLSADDFVFRYYNSQLSELAGDYQGFEGLRSFFEGLQGASDGRFRVKPISLTPFGDELVAAFATNTVSFAGTDLEVDAVVLWRVVDGRIREAWDIPAVNTVRVPEHAVAEPT